MFFGWFYQSIFQWLTAHQPGSFLCLHHENEKHANRMTGENYLGLYRIVLSPGGRGLR
jgi:MOSC domain-containing protein YiiM